MKKGKIGTTPLFRGATNEITSFANELQATDGFAIDCEAYRWCQIQLLQTESDATVVTFDIFGSQTSGSLGQSIDFVFNYHLLKAAIIGVPSDLETPDWTPKGQLVSTAQDGHNVPIKHIAPAYVQDNEATFGSNHDNFGRPHSSVALDIGVGDPPGGHSNHHALNFPSRLQGGVEVHGYQDISSSTVASSADEPGGRAYKNYVLEPALETGSYGTQKTQVPSIVVPCAPYNFLQLEVQGNTSTKFCSLAFTLIG